MLCTDCHRIVIGLNKAVVGSYRSFERAIRSFVHNFAEVSYRPELLGPMASLPGVIDLVLQVTAIGIVITNIEAATALVDIIGIIAKRAVIDIHRIGSKQEVEQLHMDLVTISPMN